MVTSLNGVYRSTVPLFLDAAAKYQYHSQAYGIVNLSATVTHNPWHAGLYVTNLFDKRANLTPRSSESLHQRRRLDREQYLQSAPRGGNQGRVFLRDDAVSRVPAASSTTEEPSA